MPFEYPVFPAIDDLSLLYDMVEEYSDRHFPLLDYYRLLPPAELDDIHFEVPDYRKQWSPVIRLRAYALPSEQSHPMTIFGIEQLRDVVLFAAVPCLVHVGLASLANDHQVQLVGSTGDRFAYSGGTLYEILEWRIGRTFANTDIPMEFQAIAEKVRLDAGLPENPETDNGGLSE